MRLLVNMDAVLRDVVERPPTALHIVRAEKSDRWPSGEWQRLEDILRAQVTLASPRLVVALGNPSAGNSTHCALMTDSCRLHMAEESLTAGRPASRNGWG